MATTLLTQPNSASNTTSRPGLRIPVALQNVFLESNRGKEVHDAPEGNVAFKTFFNKGWGFKKGGGVAKVKFSFPKIAWFMGSNKRTWKRDHGKLDDESEVTKATLCLSERGSSTRLNDRRKRLPNEVEVEIREGAETEEIKKKSAEIKSQEEKVDPKKPVLPDVSPQDYLNEMVKSQGYTTTIKKTTETGYYTKPTPLQTASYNPFLINLAREGKTKQFKSIMESGISKNPCNTHGESLVHTVCRRCEPEILRVLLDAGTTIQVCDDYGRTPLHDACWRAQPAFEIIEMIGDIDRDLFHLCDTRGSLPLSYVHSSQWGQWNSFLEKKKDIWWPRIDSAENSTDSQLPSSSELLCLSPGTRTVLDPDYTFPLDIVAMVTGGRLSVDDAFVLVTGEDKPAEGGTIEEDVNEDEEEDEDEDEDDHSFEDEDSDDYSGSGDDFDSEDYSDSEYSDSESDQSCSSVDYNLSADDMADLLGRFSNHGTHT